MDFNEAVAENIPSIVAQNQMQGATANVQRGGAAPEAQGGKGGSNAPKPKVAGRRLGPPN